MSTQMLVFPLISVSLLSANGLTHIKLMFVWNLWFFFTSFCSWVFLEMGSVEEKIDLYSDEEIPFSVSQSTNKIHSMSFEPSRHILAHPQFSASWVIRKVNRVSILRSIYIVLIKAKINALLPFGPLAILLHYFTKMHVSRLELLLCKRDSADNLLMSVYLEFLMYSCLCIVGIGLLFQLNRHCSFGRAPWLCYRVSNCSTYGIQIRRWS